MEHPTSLDDRWPAECELPPEEPTSPPPKPRRRRWIVSLAVAWIAWLALRSIGAGSPDMVTDLGHSEFLGEHGDELLLGSYERSGVGGAYHVRAWSPSTGRAHTIGRLAHAGSSFVWVTGLGICTLVMDETPPPNTAIWTRARSTASPRVPISPPLHPSGSGGMQGSAPFGAHRGASAEPLIRAVTAWVCCLPYDGGPERRLIGGIRLYGPGDFTICGDTAIWRTPRAAPAPTGGSPRGAPHQLPDLDLVTAPLAGGEPRIISRNIGLGVPWWGAGDGAAWLDASGVHGLSPSGESAALPGADQLGSLQLVGAKWWWVADVSGPLAAPRDRRYELRCATRDGRERRVMARSDDQPGIAWSPASLAVRGDRALWIGADADRSCAIWGVRHEPRPRPERLAELPRMPEGSYFVRVRSRDYYYLLVRSRRDTGPWWSISSSPVVSMPVLYRWRFP